jgi:biotin carboxylase
VRSAGVRAVFQRIATTWGQISEFLEEWKPDPFEVIVKPVESAGSDDVTLCLSVEEVKVVHRPPPSSSAVCCA